VPVAAPVEVPVEVTAADVDQRMEANVSENGTNSQDAAFETWLSAQLWDGASGGSGEPDLPEVVRAAMAKSFLTGWELLANGRESPARAE
jgi:hypothetical protein